MLSLILSGMKHSLCCTCRLFMDPLTAVRYPSVTTVLWPDVSCEAGSDTRHSGGSEEEAAGRRMRSQVMTMLMTHSEGAGAAQWSEARHAPGGVIICNGSIPDPPITSNNIIITATSIQYTLNHPITFFYPGSVSMLDSGLKIKTLMSHNVNQSSDYTYLDNVTWLEVLVSFICE